MWYSEIEVGIDRSLKIMQKTKTSQGGGEEGEGEKNCIPWPSLRNAKRHVKDLESTQFCIKLSFDCK